MNSLAPFQMPKKTGDPVWQVLRLVREDPKEQGKWPRGQWTPSQRPSQALRCLTQCLHMLQYGLYTQLPLWWTSLPKSLLAPLTPTAVSWARASPTTPLLSTVPAPTMYGLWLAPSTVISSAQCLLTATVTAPPLPQITVFGCLPAPTHPWINVWLPAGTTPPADHSARPPGGTNPPMNHSVRLPASITPPVDHSVRLPASTYPLAILGVNNDHVHLNSQFPTGTNSSIATSAQPPVIPKHSLGSQCSAACRYHPIKDPNDQLPAGTSAQPLTNNRWNEGHNTGTAQPTPKSTEQDRWETFMAQLQNMQQMLQSHQQQLQSLQHPHLSATETIHPHQSSSVQQSSFNQATSSATSLSVKGKWNPAFICRTIEYIQQWYMVVTYESFIYQ